MWLNNRKLIFVLRGVLLKFTIIMHYDKTANNPYPLTATIKAHSLSLRNPQLKFLVRGDNGTFVKYGGDVQEDQISVNGPSAFHLAEYGLDSDDAEVEYIKDGVRTKEKCVLSLHLGLRVCSQVGHLTNRVKNHRGDYRALYQNLYASIREGAEQAVKWHDSANVIQIIELAVQSSKEGRTVDVPRA